jgi:cytochrome b561
MAKFDNKINDQELLFAAHKSFGVLVLLLLDCATMLLQQIEEIEIYEFYLLVRK